MYRGPPDAHLYAPPCLDAPWKDTDFCPQEQGVDLAVLKRLFLAVKESEIAEADRQKPTSLYARRAWFLYEWLLGGELNLSAADKVSYVDAVDTDLQFAGLGAKFSAAPRSQQSSRHPRILPAGLPDRGVESIHRAGPERACARRCQ